MVSAKPRSRAAVIPAAAATAFTGHEGCIVLVRSASSQTRQPSRKPGIAKNLVNDLATHKLPSTASSDADPWNEVSEGLVNDQERRRPPLHAAATSMTSVGAARRPWGCSGCTGTPTETPSRSSSGRTLVPEASLPAPGHLADYRPCLHALAAAAYSEKVGSSTSALTRPAAAAAARNSASAPPLVGTTFSGETPRYSARASRSSAVIEVGVTARLLVQGPSRGFQGFAWRAEGVYVLAEVEQLINGYVEGPGCLFSVRPVVAAARVLCPAPNHGEVCPARNARMREQNTAAAHEDYRPTDIVGGGVTSFAQHRSSPRYPVV